MFRKYPMLPLVLSILILMVLSACGPREAVVSPAPQPTPTLPLHTLPPSPSPTASLGPEPVCLLRGEDIVSLCGTAYEHNGMITADGKLLVWGYPPFDLDQCVLRQENDEDGMNVYELPLENVTGAWLGRSSILALDKDGILWGIGSNVHGQLWDAPDHEGWDTPLKLTDHVVSAAIQEWYYSAVLKDDGGVWLMGSSDVTVDKVLPPTRIAGVEGATEIYADRFLYARDKDGVSWRLGEVEELLNDPTALMSEQYSGIRWLKDGLWLTNEGELVRTLPNGEEHTLLTNVADVDLSYAVYATAVTKDGDLYVWNDEEGLEYYEGLLTVYSPTKVMEGIKLAGAWEFGVVVVTQADGAVWAVHRDTLEATLANNALIALPDLQ